MIDADAYTVVGLILVGYPREKPWPDPTIALWVDELSAVGLTEGRAAAREMMRISDFPTIRAFRAALAVVRESHADDQPSAEMLALDAGPRLEPGERWIDRPGSHQYLADLKDWLRAKAASDKTALAPSPPARPRQLRVDEAYFYPPEPEPEPTGPNHPTPKENE